MTVFKSDLKISKLYVDELVREEYHDIYEDILVESKLVIKMIKQIKQNSDYIYFNTGDWIEACTAITEDRDGSFELKSFSKAKSVLINKL